MHVPHPRYTLTIIIQIHIFTRSDQLVGARGEDMDFRVMGVYGLGCGPGPHQDICFLMKRAVETVSS